jgi:predicted unusual protein kinase regulating ubiquinone biosynthesis (AarF/ABC1/UbiB family)
MEWIGADHMKVARQAFDDSVAVARQSVSHPSPLAVGARVSSLARSNGFLLLEANLRVLEHYTRMVPLGRRATRASTLFALATDLISGYTLLDQRSRISKSLVGPEDWAWQHTRSAYRLRDTAAALGGTLIKAGQFASTRPDILPSAYIRILSTLQDHVRAQPWTVMRRAIRRELGRDPEDIFRWIDKRPLASASIAQVHRAVLYDGRQVAVKIQYPGIGELIKSDLNILRPLVAGIARIAENVQLQPILDHLEQTLPLELDFGREARVMTGLRGALQHRKDVVIPGVIWELSTSRLLTMDFVEGIKITNRTALLEAGLHPHEVAQLLNDVYAEQMLRLGWLHADPHPGNLLVRAGPEGPELILLDHGLTLQLSPALVGALREIVRALHEGDLDSLADALRRAGMPLDAQVDLETLLQIVGVLLLDQSVENDEDHQGAEPAAKNAVEIGQSLGRGLGYIPADLILVGRALGLLDGVTKQLDPDLQALEIISGYVAPDTSSLSPPYPAASEDNAPTGLA